MDTSTELQLPPSSPPVDTPEPEPGLVRALRDEIKQLREARTIPKWKDRPRVLTVNTAFHINRAPHEAHIGDVTHAEQLKAVTRFIRWHARQVEVGTLMLAQLQKAGPVPAPEESPVL